MEKIGKRAIALDLGDSRIGVAISDLTKTIAGASEVKPRTTNDEDAQYFVNLAAAQNADIIVVGLPKNMDGTEGERASAARLFGAEIQKLNAQIRVVFMDERLSTVSAERVLKQAEMRWQNRKKVVDKVAAALILQNYLDTLNFGGYKNE